MYNIMITILYILVILCIIYTVILVKLPHHYRNNYCMLHVANYKGVRLKCMYHNSYKLISLPCCISITNLLNITLLLINFHILYFYVCRKTLPRGN